MDGGWRALRRFGAAMAGAAVLLGVVSGGARAAKAPKIAAEPVISGTPQVGTVLTASATWTGDPAPTATWTWLRCARTKGPCSEISGATAAEYLVTSPDVGSMLRVRLTVTNDAGSDAKRSGPTAAAVAAPTPMPTPTSTPTATPTPTPTPTPTAAPAPVFDSSAAPVAAPPPAGSVPQPTASRPRMLKPFPVVRIKGVLTARGARVSLLTVRAPRGVRITVACRGRDCPVRRFVPRAGARRLRPFERELRAGTRLEISVTKPGYIGKFTVIVIRRNAAPWRSDRCLEPGAKRAVRCAAP
jgi:hypothetical protein